MFSTTTHVPRLNGRIFLSIFMSIFLSIIASSAYVPLCLIQKGHNTISFLWKFDPDMLETFVQFTKSAWLTTAFTTSNFAVFGSLNFLKHYMQRAKQFSDY